MSRKLTKKEKDCLEWATEKGFCRLLRGAFRKRGLEVTLRACDYFDLYDIIFHLADDRVIVRRKWEILPAKEGVESMRRRLLKLWDEIEFVDVEI